MTSSVSLPLFTARITLSRLFFKFLGTSNISFPAIKACAQRSSAFFEIPFISSASVNTSPEKCSSLRNNEVMTSEDIEAGFSSSSETCKWPIITPPTPASTAFLKGYNSTLSKRVRSKSSTGNTWWESVSVSPCPGKCLHTAITPPSSSPRE